MKRRMTAVLILCMLLACMRGVVFAAQSEPLAAQPDLMREGSITVHLDTVTGEPVLDGSAQLVLVSALLRGPNGVYYDQNTAFGELPFDPIAVIQEKDTAQKLETIAQQNKIPFSSSPCEKGIARFNAVAPGLYLVMQDASAVVSYTRMQPALVLVPEMRDGVYLYDVDCFPKPVTPRGAIELEFIAEKKVENRRGTAPADTPFSFILLPEQPDQPMPKTADSEIDPRTGAAVVTRKGAGTVSFGTLSLGKQDVGKTYHYTIHEVKGTALHFSYDVSVFAVTVAVTANSMGDPIASVSIVDENGKSVDRVVFTNIYAPPERPEIPRTGQLWWPVVLLGFFGLLLIILGVGRRVSAKRDEQ